MGGDTQWEVEGGWMGAGHCSHHIWKGEKKKKRETASSQEAKRERAMIFRIVNERHGERRQG